MDEKKKKQLKRVGLITACLFFIFYVSYQVYLTGFDRVETVTATEKTVNNSLLAKGFFIRDEQYITNTARGTVVPVAQDGNRVSGGNTVAIAFGSDDDAATYSRIKTLESEVVRYKKLSIISPSANIDVAGLDSAIDMNISALVDTVSSGKLDELSDDYAQLRDSITKKQLMLGENIDFDSIIEGINSELSNLKKSSFASVVITAAKTGYYISRVDGCENFYDFNKVNTITPEELDGLFSRKAVPVAENVMGKMVNGFNWYIVCNLKIKDISNLKTGSSVYIGFPYSSADKVKATVVAINVSGADTAAVVMKCNDMSEELANMRAEDIEIIFSSVKGFRVPTEAVREVNGVKGVYILRSNSVTFRKINIMWSSDEYVITADKYEKRTEKVGDEERQVMVLVADDEIKQYDEIIVKGKNLYDGKAIG